MNDRTKLKIKNTAGPVLEWFFNIVMVLLCFCVAFFACDILTHDSVPVANWICGILMGAFLSYLFYLNKDYALTIIGYILVFSVFSFVAYLVLFHTFFGNHMIIAIILALIIGGFCTAYYGARHPIHN